MILKALHGFLGRPRDWTELFQGHAFLDTLQADDLFSGDITDMRQWAREFNSRQMNTDANVLLGYSLGGRLALHALIYNPELWSSAVIISTHSGMSTLEEKMRRRIIDEEWANRFENDPWDRLMDDWNNRDVFKNDSFIFERVETEYSRAKLSAVLRQWSLSRQSDLQQKVSELPMPILWIVGADDASYVQQALRLRFCHPLSGIWIVPKTGHRVPWQRPEQFLLKITRFLEMVECPRKI